LGCGLTRRQSNECVCVCPPSLTTACDESDQFCKGMLAHVRRRATASVLASASTSSSARAAPRTATCIGASFAGRRGGVDASATSRSSSAAGCGGAAPRHCLDRVEAGGIAAWERAPLEGAGHPAVWGGARAYSAAGGGAAVETGAPAKATREARRTPRAQAGLGEMEEQGLGTGAAPAGATAEAQQEPHRRAAKLEQMILRAAERRDFAEVRCRRSPSSIPTGRAQPC